MELLTSPLFIVTALTLFFAINLYNFISVRKANAEKKALEKRIAELEGNSFNALSTFRKQQKAANQ